MCRVHNKAAFTRAIFPWQGKIACVDGVKLSRMKFVCVDGQQGKCGKEY
jgi:hypothetical protein